MTQLPPITNTQKNIIYLIYRYRFLTRFHIQQLLSHAHRQKINLWLKDLHAKKYLNRLYSPKYQENTKPAIYYINTNGIRFLKINDQENNEQTQKLYYEKYRTKGFQESCFILADFVCNLLAFARKQNKTADVLTKTDFSAESDDDKLTLLKTLDPDAFYTFTGSGISKTGFIEIIDEKTPPVILKRKIRRYIKVIQNLEWEILKLEKFPSIIFLLKTEKKLKDLKKAIIQVRNEFDDEELETQLRCNLTLISNIQKNSLESPIWIKV